eukprot:jgi/Chrzof1/5907/Cz16g20080.t1
MAELRFKPDVAVIDLSDDEAPAAGSGTTVHPTKSTTPFTASVKAEHQVHSATTTKPLHTSFPTQRPGTAPSLLVLQPLQGISQPALAMNQTGTAARAGCADDSTTPASVPAGTAISTQYKPVPYEASITNPDPFPAAFDHVSAPEVQPAGRTSTPQIPQRRAAQTANQRIRQQLQPPNEDVARGASNMHSNEPMAANQFKMPIGAGGAGGGGDTAEMSKLSEQKTQGKRVAPSDGHQLPTKKQRQHTARNHARTRPSETDLPHDLMEDHELDMDMARSRQELAIQVQQQLDANPKLPKQYYITRSVISGCHIDKMLRTPALSGQSVHFNPEKLKTDHGKGVIADNSKDIICLRCEEKEELKTSWARTAWELHCGSTSQHAGDNIILTAYQMSLKALALLVSSNPVDLNLTECII